jgi:hypothetical protein
MARSSKIRSDTVRVVGLPELSKALKEIGPDAQKELREASKRVAGFVADDARAAAQSLGGVAAHVAPSIGSIKYHQFKPWRGNSSDAGYFLYPAIRQDADRIETEFTDAVDDIIKRRFPQ